MTSGCHGGYKNVAGEAKERKNGFGTWANWLAWLVQWLCTDSILGKVEVQGCGGRPSQLRTGFLAANARPIMGYAIIVQPHVSRMVCETWLSKLHSSTTVVPLGCVGGLPWPEVFHNLRFPLAQEGAPILRICIQWRRNLSAAGLW